MTGYPPPGPGFGPTAPDPYGAAPGGYGAPAFPAGPGVPADPSGYPPTWPAGPPPAYPGGGYGAPPVYPGGGYGAPPPCASGYGAPPPYATGPLGPGGRAKLDGFAVAALVLGIVGVLILSIPFGIAGLVRTGQRRRRGRGLAIAGLVLSTVWIVVVVALVAFAAGRAPTRSADGTVTHQGSISPVDLRVGDCVKVPALTDQNQTIKTLTVVPCSTLHNGQVFVIVQSGDASYPGQSELTQEGLRDCTSHAEAFLGKPSSLLEVAVFVPTQSLWDNGERGERCLLVDGAQDITGDIRAHS